MKSYLKITSLFIGLLIVGWGCQKEDEVKSPIADFVVEGDNQTSPALVKFYNSSQYGQRYVWDFGDGGKSVEESPSHTYTNNGGNDTLYRVKLMVYNEDKSDFKFKNVTVKGNSGGGQVIKADICQDWILSAKYIYEDASSKGNDKKWSILACERDNILKIECASGLAGTYKIEEGKTKCNSNDPEVFEQGTWEMNSSKSELTLSGERLFIDELTSSNLNYIVKKDSNVVIDTLTRDTMLVTIYHEYQYILAE